MRKKPQREEEGDIVRKKPWREKEGDSVRKKAKREGGCKKGNALKVGGDVRAEGD